MKFKTIKNNLYVSFCVVSALAALFHPVAYAAEFRGKVVDAAEKPIANAKVWMAQDRTVATSKSDASGVFHFEKMRPGHVDVVALKDGLAVGGYSGFAIGDLSANVVLMERDTLSIRVVNQEYKPVAGARFRLFMVNGQFFVPVDLLGEHGFPGWRGNAEGILEAPVLPKNGFVQLVVGELKYADATVAYLPVGGKRQDIVLQPGYHLRGRVTRGGKGIANAYVAVLKEGAEGPVEVRGVYSDPEGQYSMRIAKGEYGVIARHADYATPEAKVAALDDANPETVVDIDLLVPRVIEGSIVFPDNGPCGGAWVRFNSEKLLPVEVCTDTNGKFTLHTGAPTGKITITPPPGFATEALAEIPVKMQDAMRVNLDPIRLKPLPELSGTVTRADGSPAAGVLISSANLKLPLWTMTNKEGHFGFRLSYEPDKPTVIFRAEDVRAFARADFAINVTERTPLELKLASFDPDLSPDKPDKQRNDLTKLVGKPAPELKGSDWFNSQPITLESLKGKVVVLTFWAGFDTSALGMSRIDEIRALSDALGDADDVVFLSVHDGTSTADDTERYIHKRSVLFPVLRDTDTATTFGAYQVHFIPQTVLIDKSGVVRFFEVEGRLLERIKALRAGR
jgi:peroxiredoxin